MPAPAGLYKATPPHVLTQADIKPFVSALFRETLGDDAPRLGQIFDTSGIRTRHVAIPLDWFERDWSFAEKNARYVEAALELAAGAVEGCLARAGLAPADVDHVV